MHVRKVAPLDSDTLEQEAATQPLPSHQDGGANGEGAAASCEVHRGDANPCGGASEREESSAARDAVVRRLASSAVAVGELLSFLCELHSGAVMDFVPGATTTAQVVFQAVIPLTARAGTSYAALIHGDGGCDPDAMISHAWGDLFLQLVSAVVAYAVGEPVYYAIIPHLRSLKGTRALIDEIAGKHQDALLKKVWVCAFGVNQHVSICRCHGLKHLNGDPLCQMDKFDGMLRLLHSRLGECFQQVIAPGVAGLALSRAWVVSEIATCMAMGMCQRAHIRFPLTLGDTELAAAIRTLDVRNCNASRPEDKDAILSAIDDRDAYNRGVKRILSHAVGLEDNFQRGQTVIKFASAVASGGVCLLILFFSENPVAEKILVLATLLCYRGLTGPFSRFKQHYQFIFPALQEADRRGLCHELFNEIPQGPRWTLPVAYVWRKVAAACHAAPGRWRVLGNRIHVATLFCHVLGQCLWVTNGVYTAGRPWPILAGSASLLAGKVLGHYSCRMLWRSDYPKPFKRFFLLPTFILGAVARVLFAGFYLARSIQARAILWTATARERVLLVGVFVLMDLFLLQAHVHQLCRACRPAPAGGASRTTGGASRMSERVRESVDAWAASTLRVGNLSSDIRDHDLEEVCRKFGPLVGVFMALDLNLCSLGTATVTFERREDAAEAVEGLSGCVCRGCRLRVQWVAGPAAR